MDRFWQGGSSRFIGRNQPKSPKKKDYLSRYGIIRLATTHKWYLKAGFKVTPYLQEMMLWASQQDNYQAASSCLKRFLQISSDDNQLHRLVQNYGELLEDQSKELSEETFLHHAEMSESVDAEEVVYAMSDGCQLPTRPCIEESNWKEMKLGRVFCEKAHIAIEGKKNFIRSSSYVAHFGSHKDFTAKFSQVVDHYEKKGDKLVFINDGASWINDWIKAHYPLATNILDYYHAVEYLHDFAKVAFKKAGKQKAEQWGVEQKGRLLNDQINECIEGIKTLEFTTKAQQEAQHKLLTYYQNNQHRMYYQTYKNRGLLIGSGPIESAHRFVLQKRMKQSGQKWTRKGGQNIANLRIAYLNQQWGKVVDLIKTKTAA